MWKRFTDHMENLGRARAAAELVRLGYHDKARELILQNNKK